MKYLSKTHGIEILMVISYGDNGRSHVEVANLFYQRHPQLPNILQGTVSKIHAQFGELGYVKPLKRKPHFVEDNVIQCGYFVKPSSRQVTHQNNVSYNCPKVSTFSAVDPDCRMDFCKRIMNKMNINSCWYNVERSGKPKM